MTNHILNKTGRLLGIALLCVLAMSSCKNKKKLADLSDPQEEQAKMEQEEEERLKREQEAREEAEASKTTSPKKVSTEAQLHDYFRAIANASSTTSANNSIREALTMFSSPDAPLLIVFYEANGTPSYDEPTTIEKYLNYLKDTQNNKAKVDEVVMDSNGKIKEIVLKK